MTDYCLKAEQLERDYRRRQLEESGREARMTDYYTKAQLLEYKYESDCQLKHFPANAYLEVFAELENDLKRKEITLEDVREERENLMCGFLLSQLFANGFRIGDDGLWIFPEGGAAHD